MSPTIVKSTEQTRRFIICFLRSRSDIFAFICRIIREYPNTELGRIHNGRFDSVVSIFPMRGPLSTNWRNSSSACPRSIDFAMFSFVRTVSAFMTCKLRKIHERKRLADCTRLGSDSQWRIFPMKSCKALSNLWQSPVGFFEIEVRTDVCAESCSAIYSCSNYRRMQTLVVKRH